jgi:hypothetical protein
MGEAAVYRWRGNAYDGNPIVARAAGIITHGTGTKMSILLNALKQAEDRHGAARRERQTGLADDAGGHRDARMPGVETRGAIGQAPEATRAATGAESTMQKEKAAYGGLWITLFLAVVSATGFGYWMQGMSSVRLPLTAAVQASVSSPVPVAGATPAAVKMPEAGPLQLRLDRRLDTRPARPR